MKTICGSNSNAFVTKDTQSGLFTIHLLETELATFNPIELPEGIEGKTTANTSNDGATDIKISVKFSNEIIVASQQLKKLNTLTHDLSGYSAMSHMYLRERDFFTTQAQKFVESITGQNIQKVKPCKEHPNESADNNCVF